MKKHVIRIVGILLAVYVAFLVILTFAQERFIFFPKKTTDEVWKATIERLQADYISIQADDGEVLEGMFLSDHTGKPRPTVIVFNGNAVQVIDDADTFARLPINAGVNVLLMDYRGYGLSTGKPNLNAMRRDAAKIFDAAASHPAISSGSITAFGVSLGTGIATHLASVRPLRRVILLSPFASIAAMGHRDFPFVPMFLMNLLLEQNIDALALAPTITQPVLVVIGENDWTIPPEQSEKVAATWGGKADVLRIPGAGHNDLLGNEEVWNGILGFLSRDIAQ